MRLTGFRLHLLIILIVCYFNVSITDCHRGTNYEKYQSILHKNEYDAYYNQEEQNQKDLNNILKFHQNYPEEDGSWFAGLAAIETAVVHIGFHQGHMNISTSGSVKIPGYYYPLSIMCKFWSTYYASFNLISPAIITYKHLDGYRSYMEVTPLFMATLDINGDCAGSAKIMGSMFIFDSPEKCRHKLLEGEYVCQGLVKEQQRCCSSCSPYLVMFEAILGSSVTDNPSISEVRVIRQPEVRIDYYQMCH